MTPRLRFLLSKAIAGAPLWDVACDHGYLGEDALRSGRFGSVHFVDPLVHRMQEIAERLAGRTGFQLHACPAQQIQIPIAGTVVIAGVGASLIVEILKAWSSGELLTAQRLVLSPHKDAEELVDYALAKPGWNLVERVEFIERGRARDVFVYEQSPAP